jgi:hypothetical protein
MIYLQKTSILIALLLIGCNKGGSLTPLVSTLQPVTKIPISITIQNYAPISENGVPQTQLLHFFVRNISVVLQGGLVKPSSASTGLTDDFTQALADTYGFSTTGSSRSADPANNLSDMLIYQLGILPSQLSNVVCINPNLTIDGFAFTDANSKKSWVLGHRVCEKQLLGWETSMTPPTSENLIAINDNNFTLTTGWDLTGQGLPDYISQLCQLPILLPKVLLHSTASDGYTNIEKCKMGLAIDENAQDPQIFATASQYMIQNPSSSATQSLTAYNVLTLPNVDNLILIYIIESPLNGSNQVPGQPSGNVIRSAYFIYNSQQTPLVTFPFDFTTWATTTATNKITISRELTIASK